MVVVINIPYFLSTNQSPHRSNGTRRPLSPPRQERREPVALAHLVVSLTCTEDSAVSHSCSDEGGVERETCVWRRLTHLCATAACEVRLEARR